MMCYYLNVQFQDQRVNGLETKTWDFIVPGYDAAVMLNGDRTTQWGSVMSQKKWILGYTDAKTSTVADENFSNVYCWTSLSSVLFIAVKYLLYVTVN